MARIPKIKRNSEFQAIFKTGRIWSSPVAVLYVSRKRRLSTRIGICVSKKLGKAVVRNRIKRLLHESCRLVFPSLGQQADFVLLARKGVLDLGFAQVQQSVHDLLTRSRLLRQPGASDGGPAAAAAGPAQVRHPAVPRHKQAAQALP